jgi:hypothetical protein
MSIFVAGHVRDTSGPRAGDTGVTHVFDVQEPANLGLRGDAECISAQSRTRMPRVSRGPTRPGARGARYIRRPEPAAQKLVSHVDVPAPARRGPRTQPLVGDDGRGPQQRGRSPEGEGWLIPRIKAVYCILLHLLILIFVV